MRTTVNTLGSRLLERIVWGARWGLRFGLTFDAIAVIVFLLSGPSERERNGVTFATVILLYSSAGLIAGLVVGVLLPLTRWKVGAATVGVLAALPVGVLVRLMTDGLTGWTAEDTATALLFALAVGAPSGIIYRRIFEPNRRR